MHMISELGKSITGTLRSLFSSPVTDSRIESAVKDISTHLLGSNVPPGLVDPLRDRLINRLSSMPPGADRKKLINQVVFDELVSLFGSSANDTKTVDKKKSSDAIVKGRMDIVVFVGLQGAGKTTTVCKYANYYNKKGYKVGIVCADTFRAGAYDQIKQTALRIKVPYYGSSDSDPVKVAKSGVDRFRRDSFDIVIIDTSGRHVQHVDLYDEMYNIMVEVVPTKIIYIMDAGIGQGAQEQAQGFINIVNKYNISNNNIESNNNNDRHSLITSIILTKMDGTKRAGGALAAVVATGCRVEFIGSGERVEDLEYFDAKRVVGRMLGFGDVEGLAECMKDMNIDEAALLKKVKEGHFSLGDFYEQFRQIMAMGPLSKILEMVPGMGHMEIPDEDGIRKMSYVFDSMSKKELNSDGSIFEKQPKRIRRVAIGSGCQIEGVVMLLRQFKYIGGMMKKMSGIKGFDGLLNGNGMNVTQKHQIKKQAKSMLPKDLFDQMSQFFN